MRNVLRKTLAPALVVAALIAGTSMSPAAADSPAPHLDRGTRALREHPVIAKAAEDGVYPGVRVAGNDRYETAAVLSRTLWDQDNTTVVFLATGENFPDALAAGVSAGGMGPLLLVRPNGMVYPTQQELQRLAPCVVVVLGGQPSVAQYVMDEAVSYANPDQAKCEV